MSRAAQAALRPPRSSVEALFELTAWTLFALGVLARLLPFLEGGQRFLQRFPSEDGYLMLTIARNLAIGNGFSTADGTLPTNGTQPLVTLVWSALFALVGGDKQQGVALALGAECLVACATAWALAHLAARLFANLAHARATARLAAATWFASPLVVPHTMNCLESGTYALLAVLVVDHSVRTIGRELTWPRAVGGGVLMGFAFLVRNDAVFLIAAACAVQACACWRSEPAAVRARLARTLVSGLVSVVVASPWLIFNLLQFGHVVPVSGRAESLTGSLAANVSGLPIVLCEYVLTVLPIPHVLEGRPWVIALAVSGCAALPLWLWRAWPRLDARQRAASALVGLFALGLCGFYGFFFGANWFLSRYLFPLSPFLTLVFTGLLAGSLARLGLPLRSLALAGLVTVVAGVSWRNQRAQRDHMHFQVVRWVAENVAAEVWLGAIQTGTLGYFHDRTINFDGKVNPLALQALLEGRRPEYVVSTPVEYLVDWHGIVDWMAEPAIAQNFEIQLEDRERNLAVLARKTR